MSIMWAERTLLQQACYNGSVWRHHRGLLAQSLTWARRNSGHSDRPAPRM